VQIANTAGGENGYLERKKTGSLYGCAMSTSSSSPTTSGSRFTWRSAARSVQVRLNGMLVVDYIEPTPPVIPEGGERERFLDRGTFALQCHNDGSHAFFRSVRVRPLPDDTPTPGGPAPVVDDTFRQIINMGRHNVPMVDYHVHLKEGLTLEQALAKSRRDGIEYGIAINCGKGFPVDSDAGVRSTWRACRASPCLWPCRARAASGRRSCRAARWRGFDYVFTDSMTWTDNNGCAGGYGCRMRSGRFPMRRNSWSCW
jgi:hypothetical protein